MTYQLPGLDRRSFFSATAGSTSSSSTSTGVSSSAAVSSAAGASSTSSTASSTSEISATASAVDDSSDSAVRLAITVAGSASSMRASDTAEAEGVSPSKEVTCQSSLDSSLACVAASSAEDQRHEFGQAQIDAADQRDHERQEHQHHGRVADHLLAVGPDHLAELGHDLLQEVQDVQERVA